MNNSEEYRGYVLSWQEPPMTSAEWVVNVASDDRDLQARIGRGAKVIAAKTREEVLSEAKRFVDGILA